MFCQYFFFFAKSVESKSVMFSSVLFCFFSSLECGGGTFSFVSVLNFEMFALRLVHPELVDLGDVRWGEVIFGEVR